MREKSLEPVVVINSNDKKKEKEGGEEIDVPVPCI